MSELEKKLVDYMDKTAGAVEQVLEFSLEQAPMVAQEIVKYGFWSSIVATALLLLGWFWLLRGVHNPRYCYFNGGAYDFYTLRKSNQNNSSPSPIHH